MSDFRNSDETLPLGSVSAQAGRQTESLPFVRIGNYRIVAKLGQGGMGEAYLARDLGLERNVALKLVRTELGDALARFEREARVLASLDHPNIATVYGLETTDTGALALALEFIEGEDLARKLSRKPLSVSDTLDIAVQVADALGAAHCANVVHRDLKPSNVMVTKSGRVKVVDFGLARSISHADSLTDSLTKTAAVLGSPGYMSPEQLEGEAIDARSDIFSFGALLYETLSGHRAFGGSTWSAVTVATVTKEPSWSKLPSDTPDGLRDLIADCLEKKPAGRPQSFTDVRERLEAIRAGAQTPASSDTPKADVPHNLPHALTTFVGRDTIVSELMASLKEARLFTLTGPGGAGKSRIALRVGEVLLPDFPDGVWFVELAELDNPDLVPHALAKVIHVKEEPTRSLTQTLTDELCDARALIILDNCEHVLEGCGRLLNELLTRCPFVKTLATSRERLAVPGEQAFPVPPLEAHESARLFAERARLVRRDFAITDDNVDAVAELCRHLDGIPLAIELAAARTRVLRVDQIVDRLENRFQLLADSGRFGLPHHQTLRATIDWSYDLLQHPEQQLLQRVAVFAGGWSLEALVGVYDDETDEMTILERLTELVDHSLVVVETGRRGTSRYRLLESVREYGREKLADAKEEAIIRDRHLRYFLDFGRAAERNIRGPDQIKWLETLDLEHDNLLAALEWSTTSPERVRMGLRLAGAIWPFWEVRGLFDLGIATFTRVLEADESEEPSRERAGALTGAGALSWNRSDHEGAIRFHEASLAIWRAIDSPRGIAVSLGNLGLVATDQGDLSLARERYDECLRMFRELGDKLGVAKTLGNLAIVARRDNDPRRAMALNEESVTIRREIGDKRGIAIALSNLARVAFDIGDFGLVRDYVLQTVELGREIGDRVLIMNTLEICASILTLHEDPRTAALLLSAWHTQRRDLGIAEPESEELEKRLAAELDPDTFEELQEKGQSLSLSEATDIAIASLDTL